MTCIIIYETENETLCGGVVSKSQTGKADCAQCLDNTQFNLTGSDRLPLFIDGKIVLNSNKVKK